MPFPQAQIPVIAGPTPVSRQDHAPAIAGRHRGGALVAGIVTALLALYALWAWTASWNKGLAFDEGVQVAIGYNIWRHGDYRIEGANGDFVKRWATLPYLVSQPAFVTPQDQWWRRADAYRLGHRFLFELGNDPKVLLRQARGMMALLGVATGLLVYGCSRELWGRGGGLISLTLFVVSPAMLAFGGVVSTDMSITLTLFGATWCVWRLLHEVTPGRLAASISLVALMVLAKPTALVIFPITAVMLIVRFLARRVLIVSWRGSEWILTKWQSQAALVLALVVIHVFAGWAALWAHYGFRYAASPAPGDPGVAFYQMPATDTVPPVLTEVLDLLKRTHFVPEGFRKGIQALLRCDDGLGSYMAGHWRIGGWKQFFPYAIWVKTPPTVWVLLSAGMAWWFIARRRPPAAARQTAAAPLPTLYEVTPHLALIGCYLAVAMTEDINIGHRHVLPIYPALYVLAGAAVLACRQWTRWGVALVVGLLVSGAAESLAIRPHYLGYFAPQVGGADRGYEHLVDSSLDWGMDLPLLKQWVDAHDGAAQTPLFLAYFGADEPKFYGIRSTRLPGFFERTNFRHYALGPGYYAISASLLQGVYTAAFGPWSKEYERMYRQSLAKQIWYKEAVRDPARRAALMTPEQATAWSKEYDLFDNLRFARLCAWLRHHGPPPFHVGHSIFIWKLDTADLRQALMGPPVELGDDPPVIRHFRSFVAQKRP
jgi:hypothetical protein